MQSFWQTVKVLLYKDLLMEWRQRYAINGILLYLVATVFIVYLAVRRVEPEVWAALFWIIILFTAVNAVAKSFFQESPRRQLYYYTVAGAGPVLMAKMIYNVLLLWLLAALGWGVYGVMMGHPVTNPDLFAATLVLGCAGLALTFTLMSALAATARHKGTLMAILSFPVVLPVLMLIMALSRQAVGGAPAAEAVRDLAALGAVDVIVGAVGYLLFPYIWRA